MPKLLRFARARWDGAFTRSTAAWIALAGLGCGLNAHGQLGAPGDAGGGGAPGATDDGGSSPPSDDASPGEASTGNDAAMVGDACASNACTVTVPPPWQLVAFSAARTDACPAGLTQTDVVEAANLQGGCSCGCSITSAPSCGMGSIPQNWDSNAGGSAQCDSTNPAFSASGCVTNWGWNTVDGHLSIQPPQPMGGSCALPATPNAAAVANERMCTAQDSCAVCASLPGSYKLCAMAAGALACPAGLGVMHQLGTSANVSCPADCGSCTLSGTCSGELTFYDNMDCTSPQVSVAADGQCHAVNIYIAASYQWAGTAHTQCSQATPPAATVALAGEMTVCCAQ